MIFDMSMEGMSRTDAGAKEETIGRLEQISKFLGHRTGDYFETYFQPRSAKSI